MPESALGWALRPAARPVAGGGHIARCTALARALSGYTPVTMILEGGADARQLRLAADIQVIAERDACRSTFAGIVLDDYKFVAEDVARWRARTCGPVVQIEDLGRPLAGIDFAVNATPGLSGDRLNGVPAFLGPSYAMLAKPYESLPKPEIRTKVERVVIGIGLYDTTNTTQFAMEAVAKALPDASTDVLLGKSSPNATEVAAMARRHPRMRVHSDATEPWRIVQDADITISGGGQSLLERLATGIPTIGIAVADNQRLALSGAAASGAAVDLGAVSSLDAGLIMDAIAELAHDAERRRALSLAAQRLVDGRGAARVASHLLSLRRAGWRHASA